MNFPSASPAYSADEQNRFRGILSRVLGTFWTRGDDIALSRERLIISSPNGTRYVVKVSDDGELSTEAA